ncbi:MAG: hypothetical protein JKY31_00740 [Rhodobacteraceae bacterium]|nr:hypothetical protein [Paracoccaceae bacterium]
MLLNYFKMENSAEYIFLDIETSGPRGPVDRIGHLLVAGIKLPNYKGGLSLGLGEIALVTVLRDEEREPEVYDYRNMDDSNRYDLLQWILKSVDVLIAHNACFDLSFLLKEALRLGVAIDRHPTVIDTMHISKIEEVVKRGQGLWGSGEQYRHSLKSCCARHLSIDVDKQFQQADWTKPISSEMLEYAIADVVLLRKLFDSELSNVASLYLNVLLAEGDGVFDVSLVAARGMHIPLQELIDSTKKLANELFDLRQEIMRLTRIKAFSPAAFAGFLLAHGIDLLPSEKGKPQCNKLSLNLVKDDHPSIPLYLSHATKKQELDSVLGLWTGYDDVTERVYGLFNSWSAPSGRMACSNPNLMSLPKSIRKLFKARLKGEFLAVADLSQIQVRAVAKESGCEALQYQFRSGGDVHRALAASVLQKPQADVTADERSSVKPATFGFLFGGGVETFLKSQAERGNLMEWDEAENIKGAFLKSFPGVAGWQRKGFQSMRFTRYGGITGHTIGGLPYFAKTGTANLNYPIQAYDALILKIFLSEAHAMGWQVVGLLHDEVVVENVPITEVCELLAMVGEAVMDFPVEAEGAEQESWAA